MLEQFMKDWIQWKGLHTGAREESEEEGTWQPAKVNPPQMEREKSPLLCHTWDSYIQSKLNKIFCGYFYKICRASCEKLHVLNFPHFQQNLHEDL